jgi:hypothetical protein
MVSRGDMGWYTGTKGGEGVGPKENNQELILETFQVKEQSGAEAMGVLFPVCCEPPEKVGGHLVFIINDTRVGTVRTNAFYSAIFASKSDETALENIPYKDIRACL